jgi:two-component system, NarL family, sensor kinase
MLTTVKLYIELCRDQKVDVTATLSKCIDYLSDSINEIRTLSKQLSAPSLGNMDFKETLKDLIESLSSAAQLEANVTFEHLPFAEMENELHLTLYRVLQEQLTNIVKYAKATQVNISLREESNLLLMTLVDNGVGFDPLSRRTGIGITNMKSRVEILNGRFQLSSRAGDGTTLSIEIPVIIEDGVCYAEQTVLNTDLA